MELRMEHLIIASDTVLQSWDVISREMDMHCYDISGMIESICTYILNEPYVPNITRDYNTYIISDHASAIVAQFSTMSEKDQYYANIGLSYLYINIQQAIFHAMYVLGVSTMTYLQHSYDGVCLMIKVMT